MSLKIKILQAGNGDSIAINYLGDDNCFHNIIIDGGNVKSYENGLKKEVLSIIERDEVIDLLIITHIDLDHIKGVIKLLGDMKRGIIKNVVKKLWFNTCKIIDDTDYNLDDYSTEVSLRDDLSLVKYLETVDFWDNNITSKQVHYFSGAQIRIITPDKNTLSEVRQKFENEIPKTSTYPISGDRINDYNITFEDLLKKNEYDKNLDRDDKNRVSISCEFIYKKKKILLLGDIPPKEIIQSFESLPKGCKLKYDYVKLSHHGSIRSISKDFLKKIVCRNFIISTDCIRKVPNKSTITQILTQGNRCENEIFNFYFNYPVNQYENLGLVLKNKDKRENCFKCFYPIQNENYNEIVIIED